MTLGMTLAGLGVICALALLLNGVSKFFLRRSLRRQIAQIRAGAMDRIPFVKAMYSIRRMQVTAAHAQMMPSWHGPEIVQLGQILQGECSRLLRERGGLITGATGTGGCTTDGVYRVRHPKAPSP